MSKAVTVRVDSKGRITLPRETRKAMDVAPGTLLFLEEDGKVLRLAKVENPFDGLALHAIEEYRAGRTRSLREIVAEEGLDLDGK